MTEVPSDPLTMDIVASDPWDFGAPDGSNVFPAVSASRRDGANAGEFPWVLDFGDRLDSTRFFAMALTADAQRGLLAGDTVEGALLSLPEPEADPGQWRGGNEARVSARLA